MGASDWDYIAPLAEDPMQMLELLQQQVVSEGRFYWIDSYVEKPTTLGKLQELRESGASGMLMESGTHSILDIYLALPAGASDQLGALVGLTAAQTLQLFGTERPTTDIFTATMQTRAAELTDFPRWSGRWVTLHDSAGPTAHGVWGYSGD